MLLSCLYFSMDFDVKSGRFGSFISECIHLTGDGSFPITAQTRICYGLPLVLGRSLDPSEVSETFTTFFTGVVL